MAEAKLRAAVRMAAKAVVALKQFAFSRKKYQKTQGKEMRGKS
jgi:hypothetical protein